MGYDEREEKYENCFLRKNKKIKKDEFPVIIVIIVAQVLSQLPQR